MHSRTVVKPIENAYRLGREAEEAKNKSRYLIYQTRKLMAQAYAWHGADFERSFTKRRPRSR